MQDYAITTFLKFGGPAHGPVLKRAQFCLNWIVNSCWDQEVMPFCSLLPTVPTLDHISYTQDSQVLANRGKSISGSQWALSPVCSLLTSLGWRSGQLEAICKRKIYKKSAGGVTLRTEVSNVAIQDKLCYRTVPRKNRELGQVEGQIGQGPRHLRIGNSMLVFQIIMSVYLSELEERIYII